ncbi:MAG: metal ABC transporter permease [Phycisphaeraceae bacterium]|nr:metal ABC transporter permease [Phycisphaeraceae bacterium]
MKRWRIILCAVWMLIAGNTAAQTPEPTSWSRVLFLHDHNTRVVAIGTSLLGLTAGVVGSFLLLRKRALLGDALAHATLPGIAGAFLVGEALGFQGKSLPLLLAGAAVTGAIGLGAVLVIRELTRLKEDAALGIVLSVFFGVGVALLGIVQKTPTGHAAGLESFIYGKTASMLQSDAWLIAGAAGVIALACGLFRKELALLCFDAGFAASQGWPVRKLDVLLMTLAMGLTVIGLQAVGLILIIALLVIPSAAARFWTNRLNVMAATAGGLGAAAGYLGAMISALWPKMPAGAVIVLTAAGFFLLSMLLGPARGILPRMLRRIAVSRELAQARRA